MGQDCSGMPAPLGVDGFVVHARRRTRRRVRNAGSLADLDDADPLNSSDRCSPEHDPHHTAHAPHPDTNPSDPTNSDMSAWGQVP
jgi:hypothetical protein